MKLLYLLTALCALTACDPQHAQTTDEKMAALAAGNTMSCIAGDLKLEGKGNEHVDIGSFGIKGGNLTAFSLTLNAEHGGKVHIVTTSLMQLPLQTGTYHFPPLESNGLSYASYQIRNVQRDPLRSYEGGIYSQHFSPVDIDPEAKLKLQVDKLDVSAADLPGFQRVRVAGSFQFNGAALPGAAPSDACTKDGVLRSLESIKAGKRLLPMLDAKLCGAEKKHIACTFDVTADYVNHQ